jgi:hypothetical protein
MTAMARHCQHCLGDCPGDCLLPGDAGSCIHRPLPGLPLRDRLGLVRRRRFWRWFLLGR